MLASETALSDETFAELPLLAGDNVARLVARACEKFPRWGVDAGQVKLFRVPNEEQARAIQRDPSSAAGILRGNSLFSSDAVEPGSWLLARVPPPPAAAPGASRRHAGILARSHPHTLSASCRRRAEPSRALPSRRSSLLPPPLLSSRAASD